MLHTGQPLRLLQRLTHPHRTCKPPLASLGRLDRRRDERRIGCCLFRDLCGDGGHGTLDQVVGGRREVPEGRTTLAVFQLVGFVGEKEGTRYGGNDGYTLCAAKSVSLNSADSKAGLTLLGNAGIG